MFNKGLDNKLISVKQAILCIIHKENRCGENMLKMLLINMLEGLDGERK